MSKIKIKINGEQILCTANETILNIAKKNKIYIPTLCHHPDFHTKGNCGVCVVEVKGRKKITRACATKVEDGMEISTNSKKVRDARNLNIELIFAEHVEKCATCPLSVSCPLLNLVQRYKINVNRFSERKSKRKTYKFDCAIELDGTQCIDCRNCIDTCSLQQGIGYLEIKGRGYKQEIVPTNDKKVICINCGQCTLHCPVTALQEQTEIKAVQKKINNKNKIVVAQFAPSIRVSVGEEFGMPYGKIMTDQVTAGLRALGFDYVFDVNFGADITTIIEANELLERIKKGGKMPMFTSCCPAWVKYVEFYLPKLIPNLTTSRSPHVHLGGVIKTYWAHKMKISPNKIEVVSIMPCTAKKFEAKRREMYLKGHAPVDNVLTTREFAFMMKKNGINFGKLKNSKSDNPLGEHSGAGAIYGGSGGVMESALRTASFLATNTKCSGGKKNTKIAKGRIEFKTVRGMDDVKEAEVKIANKKLRVAVVNGIGNIKKVLEKMDKYDYIEVMACPGGCIGGGGQPIPTTKEIIKKRMKALYRIDKNKKVRTAHENENAMNIVEWLRSQKKLGKSVLYTKYKKRKK